MDIKILKQKDLLELRKELYEEHNGICPLCNREIDFKDTVIDHNHTSKLVRGMICRNCNVIEGKLRNAFIRYGLKDIDYQQWVYNLSEYLKDEMPMIHPREVKEKKLKKSSYNELKKQYKGKAKFPEYPKSKKLTKALERLFTEYNIEPEFYKR